MLKSSWSITQHSNTWTQNTILLMSTCNNFQWIQLFCLFHNDMSLNLNITYTHSSSIFIHLNQVALQVYIICSPANIIISLMHSQNIAVLHISETIISKKAIIGYTWTWTRMIIKHYNTVKNIITCIWKGKYDKFSCLV